MAREGDPWGAVLCREGCLGEPNLHLDLDAEGELEAERQGVGWAEGE